MTDKGYYAMYRYGRDNLITNPRAETLGEALSILWNIAPADRAASITEHNPNNSIRRCHILPSNFPTCPHTTTTRCGHG